MIDLHIHSEYSDGTSSVKEILQKAEETKLAVISITDHENCDAYKELNNIDIKKYYSGKIIPGIELKNYYKDRIIDIVGYNLDLDGLTEYLKANYKDKTHEKLQTKYLKHFYKQAKEYNLILSSIDSIEWDKNKDWASVVFYNELKKHQENEERVPKDLWENFSNFKKDYIYNRNNMFFLDKKGDFPPPEETVKKIHELGGKAFLAHVYKYQWVEDKIEFLKELIDKSNLDGIECYYDEFTEEQQQTLIKFCKERNLSMSGRNRLSWKKKTWSRNRKRKREFICSKRNFKNLVIVMEVF